MDMSPQTSGAKCFILNDLAPAFCAPALHQTQKIDACSNNYLGKWLLMFFYMSDFSFV